MQQRSVTVMVNFLSVEALFFRSSHLFLLYRLFFFFAIFVLHMSSKKLEDINGGILTYGYAVEVIVRDVSTLYPLIWRGS